VVEFCFSHNYIGRVCNFNTGVTEMITQTLQAAAGSKYSFNVTGLDDVDWYQALEAMAQSPDVAILQACRLNYIFSQLLLNIFCNIF